MPLKQCKRCDTVYLIAFHIGRFICQRCKDRREHASASAQEQRWCRKCRNYKPVNDFSFLEDLDTRETMCQLCCQKQRDRLHAKSLYKNHNMERATYVQLLAKQESRCAICLVPVSALQKDAGIHHRVLHVDHNHETGQIRGLLCHRCNHGLGFFRDSRAVLYAAIQYLASAEEHPAIPQPVLKRAPKRKPQPLPKPKPQRDYGTVAKRVRAIQRAQQESRCVTGEQEHLK